MKIHAHSSFEPPLEYILDQTLLMNQGSLWPFSPSWELWKYLQFQISFREENRLRIPESSKLEFSEKFLANNFTLLYRNSPNIARASFWEVMDSFISVAYASLAVSRTLLQQLLDCLNFTLDWENLFCWYKRKKKFLWTIAAEQAAKNHGD